MDNTAFHILTVPLEGTNLVEASAGTGKTYTIAGLFLRLILERHLSVDQILVVTFTEAATAELQERIRARLRECLHAFNDSGSHDPMLDAMVNRYPKSQSMRYLEEALRAFDQAAISTIHGYCWKVLRQKAFESGALFDTTMMTDLRNLKEEIIEDFWRRNLYEASPLFVRYVLDRNLSPAGLYTLCSEAGLSLPSIKIVPAVTGRSTEALEASFQALFEKIREQWPACREEIREILESYPGLNRNRYKKARIPEWIEQMDGAVSGRGAYVLRFDHFHKFTSEELNRSIKKGYVPPQHPFFDCCQELQQEKEALLVAFENRLTAVKVDLFRYVQEELVYRKSRKNLLSFDDLLFRFHEALEGDRGGALGNALRAKYRVALIDEFQDTDPIQYAIIRRIFETRGHILFLIGDPKQAIYSFRGADIFAYMKAAKRADEKYDLGQNWRSCSGLVHAVNTIFSNVADPFVFSEIPFRQTAAARQELKPLCIDGAYPSPFRLWFVHREKITGQETPIPKYVAKEAIYGAVVREIVRLVRLGRAGRASLGERNLTEGDIAILVRKNDEAHIMHETLSHAGISSVVYSAENLFDSLESLEMERILAAIVAPNDEGKIKAALSTDIMGITGDDLEALAGAETLWEERLVRFNTYHHIWREKGFIQMFRTFLRQEAILSHLMGLDDGERRCTNLQHLSEVLQQAFVEKKLGMTGLVKWLSEQRDRKTSRLDEHQIRLERDEDAVKIITIHRSKGLEYPVVFCPFAWEGSQVRGSNRPFTFHDGSHGKRLTLDLGSADRVENRLAAETELLSENLRLVYVALTRAKHCCYFVWGRMRHTETSAPAYLFHGDRHSKEDPVSATARRFQEMTDRELVKDLRALVEKSQGAIALTDMPVGPLEPMEQTPADGASLVCKKFTGKIDRSWKITSFSALISGQTRLSDMADHDALHPVDTDDTALPDADPIASAGLSFFSFPKGTLAGTFVHDVFEHLDFTDSASSQVEQLVREKLVAYGFDPMWTEATCGMLQKVLNAPLERDRPEFTLSHIKNRERLNELPFYFPLKTISARDLRAIVADTVSKTSIQYPDGLHFAQVKGFMRGFIDLVFHYDGRYYLVDWKSNYLGESRLDYNQQALSAAMGEHFYFFQSWLYAVALDQYLRLRVPGYNYETHFGAIYYLFVRGMDDDGSDYGIFRDRPSQDFMRRFSDLLLDNRR